LSLDIEVKHKKMTRFLCQELLYEYISGVLDTRRQEDVREHLAECKESQRELEKLKKGLAFSQKASHFQVSPKLHQALLNFEPQWQKRLREWTLWSSERGWKMLPYAFITLTIVLGLVVTKPWKRQEAPEITLAEQLQKEPDMIAQDQGKPIAAPVTTPEDATKPAPIEAKPAEIPLAAAPIKPKQAAPITPPSDTKPTSPVPLIAKKDVAVAASAVMINTTSPNVLPKPEVAQVAATQPSTQKMLKPAEIINEPGEERLKEPIAGMRGSLTRGEIDVNDFSNSWQAIRDKIIALDGKVAGNVELGWLRRPDQAYFHFTLPESNYSELELYLSTFGPVRFSKERHPRVMPEGQIRIILTVKDAVTHESGETP
jgi:hypothetical protein